MSEPAPIDRGLTVGAAAGAAGVNVQTLHYYERRGLVRPRSRSGAGYRVYGEAEVQRVRAIKQAQSLCFTLGEIRELISLAESRQSVSKVSRLAQSKLAEIDDKIHALERVRATLEQVVETCACKGDLSRCDVIAGLVPEGGPRA